jgi:hypothetical protein
MLAKIVTVIVACNSLKGQVKSSTGILPVVLWHRHLADDS